MFGIFKVNSVFEQLNDASCSIPGLPLTFNNALPPRSSMVKFVREDNALGRCVKLPPLKLNSVSVSFMELKALSGIDSISSTSISSVRSFVKYETQVGHAVKPTSWRNRERSAGAKLCSTGMFQSSISVNIRVKLVRLVRRSNASGSRVKAASEIDSVSKVPADVRKASPETKFRGLSEMEILIRCGGRLSAGMSVISPPWDRNKTRIFTVCLFKSDKHGLLKDSKLLAHWMK